MSKHTFAHYAWSALLFLNVFAWPSNHFTGAAPWWFTAIGFVTMPGIFYNAWKSAQTPPEKER